MRLVVRSCHCLKHEDATMAQVATTHHHSASDRIFEFFTSRYEWLATWAERNVEPGEDDQHIPGSVRNILKNRGYYI